jgi:hypothetical protein
MERFFFDLLGSLAATDRVGHTCSNQKEAIEYGRLLAHRVGLEKPHLARPGNCIRVRDRHGFEICRAPIAARLAA